MSRAGSKGDGIKLNHVPLYVIYLDELSSGRVGLMKRDAPAH